MSAKLESTLAVTIIEAVAAREGVTSTEIRKPLADVIDPDALDTLFANAAGRARFTYHGYHVTVHSDGTVDLNPLDN